MSLKEKILDELESNTDIYISGQTLAEKFGVSRNAVWKCIRDLRKAGYEIASQTNKGYALSVNTDIISSEGISLYLPEGSERLIYVYDTLDSTNTEAKRMIVGKNGTFLHGTVIVARSQSDGRGHTDKGFSSPEGGIYLSIILEPKKMKKTNTPVTEMASSAVKQTLEELLDIRVEIRKHSAIYQGRKKICGILTEGISDLETGVFSNYIVGIGIRFDEISSTHDITKNKLIAGIIEKCQP